MKIVIVGMGRSGYGVRAICEKFGYEYECIDSDKEKGLPESVFIPEADLYVLSPGIPNTHTQIKHAIEQNIPWIGEVEFALRHATQRIIGITGTNGKTTVVSLLAHLLPDAIPCGNIGYSLSQAVVESDENALLIAELSSYQLETIQTPILDAGVILNIKPDHLDRYSSFREYAFSKLKIRHALKPGAPLFVNDQVFQEWKSEIPNAHSIVPFDVDVGSIGKENAAFAYQLSGMTKETFLMEIKKFNKPAHRIEFVKKLDGISFYDDSKGTNIAAVLFALSQFEQRIVLIAGGQGKGESFRALEKNARKQLRAIIAIGEMKEQICDELSSVVPVEMALTLEEAVQKAYATAESNEIVLLSPGCASFDMFSNYIHRGETFKKCVEDLVSAHQQEPKKAFATDEQYMLF